MADNVPITAGSGTDVATDDVTGVHYQKVKLAIGAADAANLADGNSGNKSDGTLRVVLATDQPALTNKLLVTPDLPTGASSLAEQQSQTTHLATIAGDTTDIEAAVELIDDTVYTDDTSTHATGTSKVIGIGAVAVPTDAAVNANDIAMPAMTTDRKLHVAVMDALPAGTAAIGKLAANTGVTIGAVELAAAQTLATVTTVGTLTNGGVAHGTADSGNPHKIGGKVETAASTATMEADGDRTDFIADADGMQLVRLNYPLGDMLVDATSNTDGASTGSGVFTATASTRSVITSIHVFRTDAGTTPIFIDFRDGTAGSVLWRMVLPPNGGSVMNDVTGIFRTTANTALAYDVSAATTTVYINVSGFKTKV